MPSQAKRGRSASGPAAARVTFQRKGLLRPPAGLAGVIVLAFASHFEMHFLIQEHIRHAEATLTPFLGLDGGGRKREHLAYRIRHMGITIHVRIRYSPSERLQLKAK